MTSSSSSLFSRLRFASINRSNHLLIDQIVDLTRNNQDCIELWFTDRYKETYPILEIAFASLNRSSSSIKLSYC
ncbi:hypothetical protein M6B38_365675 [Iris pallida]|uniref:HAT C-terminal dimerisation domain-containing protein n=1 Tax=Iris pallida TaxID=29817 RepID=A0AAX6GHA3_IRIPA|nr:hypothetical protein M6B38_365675 [Iris pallida]